MLEYQREKFEKKFEDYILKIDPYILRISGYNPQETLLKIGDYLLHCIPATFSLSSCNLLLSLGEKEIEFFQKYKESLISLNFSFDPAYFNKSTSFFLKGKFENLKKVRPGVYTMLFSFTATPNSYKELFFHLSNVVTIHEKFYITDPIEANDVKLVPTPFNRVKIIYKGNIIKDDELLTISAKNFKIKSSPELLDIEEIALLHFRVLCNTRELKLVGKKSEQTMDYCTFSLNFNTEYIHTLSRLYRLLRTRETKDHDNEELEEL